MVDLASPSPSTTWVVSQFRTSHGVVQRDSMPLQSSPSSSNSSSRISPAVLFIIVILAVIFFVSGLLHLLVRFLIRKRPSSSSPHSTHQIQEASNQDALQRQLQQLFHLHDSGLDQAFIDALPVFLYREIVGSKEPFDCAVCLCEFSQEDKLRLLPICGHAFHLNCIDTWLLSNSTCPLCRGALFVQGDSFQNPIFDYEEEVRLEEGQGGARGEVEEIRSEKRVMPVRLGKFRNTGTRDDVVGAIDPNASSIICREEGESSSSNLDARRCFSMGSYQYVVGDANLRVALSIRDRNNAARVKEMARNPVAVMMENEEGKRIGARSKGESFSVSKIWLWGNNKGKLPVTSDNTYLDGALPWMTAGRTQGNT